MLYLLLAIVSSSLIAIIMRFSAGKIKGNLSMLATNYIVCSLCGAAYAKFDVIVPSVAGFYTAVGLGCISGGLFLAGFILLQTNTYKNGVVLSSTFMKLGLLVPIVLSVCFFHEIPTEAQVLGFIIAVIAIIMINLKKEGKAKGMTIGLLLLLLIGGSGDAMAKVYEVFGMSALSNQYLFYNFFTAFVLCLILVILKKERPGKLELIFGACIGIPNFFSSKFLLAALGQLSAVVVYPTFSVATILVVTLVGMAAFKERLKKLQWIALVAILFALVLLNI